MVDEQRIAKICGQIAEEFHPEKIILFGSYAYGRPRPDSDVDLLVVLSRAKVFENHWGFSTESHLISLWICWPAVRTTQPDAMPKATLSSAKPWTAAGFSMNATVIEGREVLDRSREWRQSHRDRNSPLPLGEGGPRSGG